MRPLYHIFSLLLMTAALACHKHTQTPVSPPPVTTGLSYGDSVFFLDPAGTDIKKSPLGGQPGRYFGWPEGIVLDQHTGVIDVTQSETGLKYLISFVPDGRSDTLTTRITISGINYLDGFYRLSAGDSIAQPIYDGSPALVIPGVNAGSIFDEGNNCNSLGCNVDVTDGRINLAQTVRNGVFGATPSNNDRHEFVLHYRINDKSGKAANSLNIKLYYFDSMSSVSQEAYDIINSRQGTIVTGGSATLARPRPPCLFIVAR